MQEEILLIMFLYILPMLLVALTHWFDDSVKTIGDFLEYLWVFLFPIFNIFVLFVLIMHYFIDKLKENKIGKKINDNWTKFKNIEIR